MKRRIHTKSFVDKHIGEIDKIHDRLQETFAQRPDLSDKSYLEKQLNEYIKYVGDTKYVKGFWWGYTIAMGIDFDKE